MADAVFRVAADVAEYITGMARADAATKKVARSAGSIGDQVGASIIKIELLNRALNAAGRAISGVMDKATGAATSAGERAIGLATSLGSLGVRDINATTRALSGGQGGTTAEQKAQFAKSLADANKQRRTGMTPEESQAALDAFVQFGEFGFGAGGQDLLAGISEGRSVQQIAREGAGRFDLIRQAATDPMSPLFQGLRGRMSLSEAQREEEEAFLVSGTSKIAETAAMRVKVARDPGGPVSIMQGTFGDTAATILNNQLTAAAGEPDAATRATDRAATATVQMAAEFRKLTTAPNFATEVK